MKKKVYSEYSDIITNYIGMVQDAMKLNDVVSAKYYYHLLVELRKQIAFDNRLDGDSLGCLTAVITLSCAMLKDRYLELQRS